MSVAFLQSAQWETITPNNNKKIYKIASVRVINDLDKNDENVSKYLIILKSWILVVHQPVYKMNDTKPLVLFFSN